MNHWMGLVSLVGIVSTAVMCGTDMFFLTIGRPALRLTSPSAGTEVMGFLEGPVRQGEHFTRLFESPRRSARILGLTSWIVGDPGAGKKKRASRKLAGFVSTSRHGIMDRGPHDEPCSRPM
jgi:hypothetical protein